MYIYARLRCIQLRHQQLCVRVNSHWISWDRVSWVSYVYTEITVQQYQMLLYIMREKRVERTSNHRASSFISRLK